MVFCYLYNSSSDIDLERVLPVGYQLELKLCGVSQLFVQIGIQEFLKLLISMFLAVPFLTTLASTLTSSCLSTFPVSGFSLSADSSKSNE